MGYGLVRAAALAASILSTAAGAQQFAEPVMTPAVMTPAVMAGAVVPVEDAEPAMPAGGSPNFVPPSHDDAGYVTPNRSLSPEETTWHVRVALNVAALGCRGAEATELVNGYNALLTADKEMLAAAATAMGARYKARYGTAWQARHDDAMTKLYNFWALPPAQGKFCGAALQVLREAAAIQPAAFPAFAAAALPRLEAPMVAFFGAFDQYLSAREAWRTRRARAMIAASVPATAPAAAIQTAAVEPTPLQPAVQPAVVQTAALEPAMVAPAAAAPAVIAVATPVRFGTGEP